MTIHAIGLTTLNNTAKDFRNDMSGLMFGATAARPTGARSGVRYGTPTDTVTVVGSAGTIKPHAGVMDVQTSATAGPYFYAVTANELFTVNAAHATNPRIDIVTIRINDNVEDSSSLESATAHYTAGTAAASPVAPTPATTREMVIATLYRQSVAAGGSVTVSWVAPYAVAAGGIIPVRTVTERAALYTAYPATADCPVMVWQADIKRLLITTDGVNWKDGSGRFVWADATARTAATGMASDDRGYQIDTKVTWRYSGSAWVAWDAPDWVALTLLNSWVTFGGAFATPSVALRNGVVELKGAVKSGTITAGTVIANLPAAYRPSESRKEAVMLSGSTFGSLDVTSAGDVTINVANATYTSLDFSFPL